MAAGPPALPGGGWYGNASLNTPSLYAGGGNNDREHYPEIPPTPARSDTLVLWHHGPAIPTTLSSCAALALLTLLVNAGSLYRDGKST